MNGTSCRRATVLTEPGSARERLPAFRAHRAAEGSTTGRAKAAAGRATTTGALRRRGGLVHGVKSTHRTGGASPRGAHHFGRCGRSVDSIPVPGMAIVAGSGKNAAFLRTRGAGSLAVREWVAGRV